MKTCKLCCKELPDEAYYKGKQRERGKVYVFLDSYCIPCRNSYQNDRKRSIKKQSVEFLGGACESCGLRTEHVECYDFHHKTQANKDFTIAKAGGKSFEALKKELAKCSLLCANCHRIAHAGKAAV